MKEFVIGTKTCDDEQGRGHTFRYFLVVDQVQSGETAWEDYGIGISEENGERAVVRGITPLRRRIEELAGRLMEYAATPVNLPELVEDWL